MNIFNKHEYNSKERFCSYWHQINEIHNIRPKNVLEIGLGNGFLSRYIKNIGYELVTVDIDASLVPTYVASVLALPFAENKFDVVVCYEVLEHLPFDKFREALLQIYNVSRSYIIISLPDSERAYRYIIKLPFINEIKKMYVLPRFKKKPLAANGEHYWEIGRVGYPLDKIIKVIKSTNLIIEKTYRVFEMPYHRYFVLKKDHERTRACRCSPG